jgi:hypothetical protein
MDGCQHRPNPHGRGKFQHLTALLRDPKRTPQQRPYRRGTQTNDQGRVNQRQLRFEPRQASFDVGDLRRGVDSPLSSLGETKVLDGIGDIDILPSYTGFIQGLLKQPPSRTDKGNALPIFDVAGLLSHEG